MTLAKRRNKWVCALKEALSEVGIFGPTGNPDAATPVKKYTEVPWEEAKREAQGKKPRPISGPAPDGGWKLSDNNASLREYYQSI